MLADAVGVRPLEFRSADVGHLRQGQAAEIVSDGRIVGFAGRLSDELSAGYKFRQPVFVAEVDLQALLDSPKQGVFYSPLPVYPSVIRDISLLVRRSVTFEDVRRAVAGANVELLRSVEFVDVYEGKGVADDERSLTVRLGYRSDERTLTDEQVDEVHSGLLRSLETETNAKLRF
jgi:phenylalanyl-tRNA synthetase beta chain